MCFINWYGHEIIQLKYTFLSIPLFYSVPAGHISIAAFVLIRAMAFEESLPPAWALACVMGWACSWTESLPRGTKLEAPSCPGAQLMGMHSVGPYCSEGKETLKRAWSGPQDPSNKFGTTEILPSWSTWLTDAVITIKTKYFTVIHLIVTIKK